MFRPEQNDWQTNHPEYPSWTFKGRWWQWFGWKKRRAIELLHKVGIKEHEDIMQSYPEEITEGEGQKS